jgi:hypothetical protein
VTRHGIVRLVSIMTCAFLLGLAIYTFPAEPLTTGLFARELSSPLWYRGGRLVLMTIPLLFSAAIWRQPKNRSARDEPACGNIPPRP